MNSQILHVEEALREVFQKAQDNNTTRCLEVHVKNECLVANKAYAVDANMTPETQWQTIQSESNAPCLLLFHIASTNGPWKWILVAYVSDSLPVREKMLYASARDCVKQQLGLGYFVGDVHTTDLRSFSFQELIATMHHNSGPLSEIEVLLKEEARLERDLSVKASAMNVMPFGVMADCARALKALAQSSMSEWLSLKLENEKLAVDKSVHGILEDQVNDLVEKQVPSFVVYRYVGMASEQATMRMT
jgi:hypothetical protein